MIRFTKRHSRDGQGPAQAEGRRRVLAGSVAVVVAGLVISGCGGSNGSSPAGASTTFTRSAAYAAIAEWDPAVANGNETAAFSNVYETLTHYDVETQKVGPGLATTWESSKDAKTWTFTLQPGVTFHSGTPMDAEAVAKAIQRTIDIGKGSAYIWSAVESITATDATTLTFELKYPADIPLIASAQYGAYIYDVTAAGDVPSAQLGKWFAQGRDAGTGPYTVDAYTPGKQTELTLKRHPKYWKGWSGTHYERVVYNVTTDVNTASQLLTTGRVDWVQTLTPQLFAQAKKADGVQTTTTSSFANLIAFFNTASGPMADLNVRKALQSAIDYEGIISTLKGAAVPASGLIPKGLTGATDDMVKTQDLDAAKAALQASGYGPGGKKLTLTMTYAQGDEAQRTMATILTSTLKSLNVDLQATAMDFGAQASEARSTNLDKRQDIFVMYWYPSYADPQTWFSDLFRSSDEPSFNLSYLDDDELDQRIDSVQLLAATSPDDAAAEYVSMQRKILETDAAAAPILVQTYQRAYRAGIKGYVDNPVYTHATYVYDLTPAK